MSKYDTIIWLQHYVVYKVNLFSLRSITHFQHRQKKSYPYLLYFTAEPFSEVSWHRSRSVLCPSVKLVWGKSAKFSLLLSSALLQSSKWSRVSDFIPATLFILKHAEFSSVNRCISRVPDVNASSRFPFLRGGSKKRVIRCPLLFLFGAHRNRWWQTFLRENNVWKLRWCCLVKLSCVRRVQITCCCTAYWLSRRPIASLWRVQWGKSLQSSNSSSSSSTQWYEKKYCTRKTISKSGH